MGRTCKVVVCGSSCVGKTALLEQAIFGNHVIGNQNSIATIEDIYVASVESNRGVRERVRFYDTRGLDPKTNPELPKHYFAIADGFILVYSITSSESFQQVQLLKKEVDKISKEKDKREVSLIVVGNKADLYKERQVEYDMVCAWAQKEKVPLYEVTVANRKVLMEPIVALTSKLTLPIVKSSFPLRIKPKQMTSTASHDV
ncbi:NF-kappa-B inhibitor-interacting Ras-like protein 2 isoform X1 [Acanthaster planci]|uniref:NF-kappa-B inhibitor-interacting Ras-like protein 2 isoform X1 n=1 Tax=Acanthaster planci TaxID=133434 RepID=A0A8B7ZHJ0_ACAPL|nr:NF-kappa-B inhibitor-interacting Ras-like protein 2 isoform X1 [Acanthaster planci]